jgi:hypothetical protein
MRSQRMSSAVGIPARIGGSPGIRTPTRRIKNPLLCRSMLVIQFAKLFHRSRKFRGLDFPFFRSALGGVANKLYFVSLVNRHGTAPCSHGLKGQRATFLLAVHIRRRVSQSELFVRHCVLQCAGSSRRSRRKDDARHQVASRSSSSPF